MQIQHSQQYLEYMNSDRWRYTRLKRIDLDNGHCQMCGSQFDLEVHHMKYDRLGNEDIVKDLVTLCRDCHKKLHTLWDRRYR